MSAYFAVSVVPVDGPRMTPHGTVLFMLLEGGTNEQSTPSTAVGRHAAAKVSHIETLDIYRRTGNVCERLIIASCDFFPGFAIIGTLKIITTRYHVHRMRVDVAQIISYRNYWKCNQLIFPQT